jgi:hypothetical protein
MSAKPKAKTSRKTAAPKASESAVLQSSADSPSKQLRIPRAGAIDGDGVLVVGSWLLALGAAWMLARGGWQPVIIDTLQSKPETERK